METINQTRDSFFARSLDKPAFIKAMFEQHHAALFDYCQYLSKTNIKSIEIEDGRVVMTTRDRGVRFICRPGDFRSVPIEILNFFDAEKDESMMMENLVSDGDIYFDIGANIGYHSINISASHRSVKVHAFEPIATTYSDLVDNISLNSILNVTPHNFGFSNKSGEFPFYYYSEASGNASSADVTGRADVEVILCKVRTLDEYMNAAGHRVDFIKCDVEGAELLVYKGGINTISREKPIVFSEILRKWSDKFNYNPNEIFDFFRRQGYCAFTVKGNTLFEFTAMDESTVETNFFFLHAEKHSGHIQRYT